MGSMIKPKHIFMVLGHVIGVGGIPIRTVITQMKGDLLSVKAYTDVLGGEYNFATFTTVSVRSAVVMAIAFDVLLSFAYLY